MVKDGKGEPAWHRLNVELAAWAGAGRVATFWWRDDDAAAPSEALERLFALASCAAVPLALAVIPGRLQPGVDELLAGAPLVRVVQHGFDHTNHASGKEGRASELRLDRGLATVLGELSAGLARLNAAFPGRVAPVLVPPWNRIDPGLVASLPALGYRGLSTFGPRAAAMPVPGLVQINAHCDPLRWKEGRRFTGLPACIDAITGQLRASRRAQADGAEPVGLLTHHLDLDEAAWDFAGELLRRLAAHPAAQFAAVDAFLPGAGGHG